MAKTKCLKNPAGRIFVWTENLSQLEGMQLCDATGKLIDGAAEEPTDIDSGHGADQDVGGSVSLDDYKVALDDMDREELEAKADELDVQFQSNLGDEKLRARILAVVEERLKESQND